MTVFLALILALAKIVSTPQPVTHALPAVWNHWKYIRAIRAPIRSNTVTLGIVVPASMYANALPSLGDVRIIDASGEIVPFTIETPPVPDSPVWKATTLSDAGFVPGHYSQAVADLGPHPVQYNAIEIDTPLDAFATYVDIDASDDNRTWRIIRTKAPIYDYHEDGLATNMRVHFGTSTARYLRVRVLDATNAFPISGIQASEANAGTPESMRYPVTLHATRESSETVVGLDGIYDVPLQRLRLDTSTPRFARTVDIETSNDGTNWGTQVSQLVSRIEPGDDNASITFPETQEPYWRIRIHNGDDAPLAGVHVEAYGAPRSIYFDSEPRTAYSAIYGNPYASAPLFDYAETHTGATLETALPAAIGAPQRNLNFVSGATPVPWSENHPWILWSALILAVAAIGTLAIRTMSSREASAGEPRRPR